MTATSRANLWILVLAASLFGCGKVQFDGIQPSSSHNNEDILECHPSCTDPISVHESFIPFYNKAIDILFTIDNSGSMEIEQDAMSKRLGTFLSKIDDLDWRIAITSTDTTKSYEQGHQGRLYNFVGTQKYLTPQTPDHQNLFASAVHLGSNGDGSEEGISASLYAVDRNEANWMRKDSHLAVVVLSDEDENSDGTSLTERNQPKNLINRVATVYGRQKGFSFHSLVILDKACQDLQAAQLDDHGAHMPAAIGAKYIEASQLTGGIKGSICTTDYGIELSTIGSHIVQSAKAHVLQCLPLPDSLIVRDSAGHLIAAHAEGNRLILDQVVADGEKLSIDYQCQP